MFSMNKLSAIYEALTAISGLKVYHYFAPSQTKLPYCVWYEDGEASALDASNHKAEQAIRGYVEYFTKTEFDSVFDSIQSALNSIENLGWSYESTIYGDPSSDDDNTIHHTWSWELM